MGEVTMQPKNCDPAVNVVTLNITGDEVDEMMAQAQSLYAWTLYEQGLAAEGITPDGLGIPKPADFDFSKGDLTNVNPWP